MQFLIAFIYLLLHIVRLWLGNRAMSLSPARVRAASHLADVAGIRVLPSVAGTLVLFVQFYALTRIFPLLLVVVFAIVNLLTLGGSYALRAIFGLDTQDKTHKTKTLGFIFGLTNPLPFRALLVAFSLTMMLWPIAVLWVYFSSQALNPEAVARLAIFHFFIPACLTQVMFSLTSWNLMTSHHLDDDTRIDNFLGLTVVSINSTVFALYPVYLIVTSGALAHAVLSIGLLLSIPVFIFVTGSLLPFVVGTFRYRWTSDAQARWRRDWVMSMVGMLKLPVAETTVREAKRLTNAMDHEIADKFTQDRLFRSLQEDWTALSADSPTANEQVPLAEQTREAGARPGLPATVPPQPALGITDDHRAVLRRHLQMARDALRGSSQTVQGGEAAKDIRSMVQEERENLVEWDASFAHLSELLDLREATIDYDQQGLLDYLRTKQAQLDEIAKVSAKAQRKSTWLLTFIGSVTSSALLWVFNQYSSSIIDFVGSVIARQ